VRLAILTITLFFIPLAVFAQGAPGGLQLAIEEVRYNRTVADSPKLEIVTIIKGDYLKKAKRKRMQIVRAQDNLGNELKLKEYNLANEDFSIIDKRDDVSAAILIELKYPSEGATQITKVEGNLELYIPDFDSKAKLVLPDFSEKLARGFYFEKNIFALQSQRSSQPPKFEASLRATYSLSSADSEEATHIINIQIEDKGKKVLDVMLTDREGNDVLPGDVILSEDKTDLRYRFYRHPREIADLVIYLRTFSAIQILPLEYKSIPLP